MSAPRTAAVDVLTCPGCRAVVPARAASCRACHLPMADVLRHQAGAGSRRRASLSSRLWGLAAYAGVVAWCLAMLPTAATFVVPAAVVAAVLHVVRGRPYLGALVFVVVVAVAPPLFWSAMGTEIVDELGSLLGR